MVSRLVCDLPGHTPLKTCFLITWLMCMKSWLDGEQTGLWLTWSHTYEDRFSHTWLMCMKSWLDGEQTGLWLTWSHTSEDRFFSSRGSCAWNHGWVVSRLVCDLPGHTPLKTGFLITWLMCMKSWLDGEQTGLWLTWSHTFEDRFFHYVAHVHEIMVGWWADWFVTYLVTHLWRHVFSSHGSCMKSWFCGEQTGLWLTWSHTSEDRFSHHMARAWNHGLMVSRLVCDLPGHTPMKIGFLITWLMCMKSWLDGEQSGLWLTWSHTSEDRFSHHVAHAWNHVWMVSRVVCDLPGHTPLKIGFFITMLMCMKSWLDGEQTGLWLTWSHTSEARFPHHVAHAWNHGWMVSRLVCDLPGHTPLKTCFLITWLMCMKSWLGGEQTGLWLTWSHTSDDRFSHHVAHVHEIMVGWWADWFVTYLVTHLWR